MKTICEVCERKKCQCHIYFPNGYPKEKERCEVCDKKLTTKLSRYLGIGPCCLEEYIKNIANNVINKMEEKKNGNKINK